MKHPGSETAVAARPEGPRATVAVRVAWAAVVVTVLALTLSALVVGLGGGTEPAGEPSPAWAEARTLTVATVEGALPLSGTDAEGRLRGFHVAVARTVCARLGVDCRFAMTAPGDLLAALDSGAVDLVAADIVVRPQDAAGLLLAPPHARRASLIVARRAIVAVAEATGVPPSADLGMRLATLSGRVLVAVAGSDQEAALRALAPGDVPMDVTVALAEGQAEALRALRAGEADAALLSLSVALDFLTGPDGEGFAPFGGPLSAAPAGGDVSLVMAGGDQSLARAVARVIEALRRDGGLMVLARETLPLPEIIGPTGWARSVGTVSP